MSKIETVEQSLLDALSTIINFVTETTGRTPTQTELAAALKRYFVMKEIKDHIFMEQEGSKT